MYLIRTYTGRMFNLLEPQMKDVCIEDIAHALAYLCRYTGHCRSFYSVAQHSCLASQHADGNHGLAMKLLLHDAAEAYTGGLSSPLKAAMRHADVDALHVIEEIERVVADALGLDVTEDEAAKIHEVNRRMLATEYRDLMLPNGEAAFLAYPPGYPVGQWGAIKPMSPAAAERDFLILAYGERSLV